MEMKVRCDKQKLHLPITDYFSEWRPPHPSITAVASNRIFATASVIDTFSAGEGYGFGRF